MLHIIHAFQLNSTFMASQLEVGVPLIRMDQKTNSGKDAEQGVDNVNDITDAASGIIEVSEE